MERLQELINQLSEQAERKAEPTQMLLTTRLLEAELNRLAENAAKSRVSAKVAVMMPSSMKIYMGQPAPEPVKSPEVANLSETVRGSETVGGSETAIRPEVVREAEVLRVSEVAVVPAVVTVPEAAIAPEVRLAPDPGYPSRPGSGNGQQSIGQTQERGPWPYDPLAEVPTLTHQKGGREINDVIGLNGNGSSLNDKLKSDVLELKSALNDTPVRDLKKAIGVNDRFVFISQLFRGDEVMYERSLKTINGFRILPEAEYWMERELKVKLGWDESRETTKHFYHLVRRRFS